MKKRIKIFLTISTAVATGLLASACSGCAWFSDELDNEVSFTRESCELLIGEEYALSMEYRYDEDERFCFVSSDESVASVDENGKVLGVSKGTATITVVYGNASDECQITVGTGNLLAMLQYDSLPESDIRITTADTLELNPSVLFNGKTYRNMQVSYGVSDTSVGTVTNGVFVPNKTGRVEILAQATWQGLSGETLQKTIEVEVVNDVQLFVNGGTESSFLLYTIAENEKTIKTGATEARVTASATENGTAINDVAIELIDGDRYVDFVGDKIISKGVAGTATLQISCKDSENNLWTKTVPVTVTQSLLEYEGEEITNFSAVDGEVVGGRLIREAVGGRIVRAEDENGDPLTVTGGKILGVQTSPDGETTTRLTVYTQKAGYEMTVKGYTGIFDEAEDLALFGVHNQGYQNHPLYENTAETYRGLGFMAANQDGYYILADNIDASNYTQKASGSNLNGGLETLDKYFTEYGWQCGLTGTFDGRGYTIRGLTVSAYGLFGIVYGGVIKNVAFTDVKFAAGSGLIAAYLIDATLQNVYVQADSLYETGGALLSTNMSGVFMTGCLFNLPQEKTEAMATRTYGSLGTYGGKFVKKNNYTAYNGFNGVYVISPLEFVHVYSKNSTTGKVTQYTIDSVNKEGYTYLYEGILRYDTEREMSAAYTEKAYEKFSTAYWDLSGKIPLWKTEDFEIVEKEDEVNGEHGYFNPDWVK